LQQKKQKKAELENEVDLCRSAQPLESAARGQSYDF
jgi:hypothetical protein